MWVFFLRDEVKAVTAVVRRVFFFFFGAVAFSAVAAILSLLGDC